MEIYPLLLLLLYFLASIRCFDTCDRSVFQTQLLCYKKDHKNEKHFMTTSTGNFVEKKHTSTLNKNLVRNEFFLDSISQFVSERIPERVLHGNGAGGFGYFEVTHNITNVCKAKFLNRVGKRTPVSTRFSPGIQTQGGYDTIRESRGFAVQFDTEDGIFDLHTINIPVFPVKDPLIFISFSHAMKKNPVTNLKDPNSMWDFITSRPEIVNFILRTNSDVGIPAGYQYMPGFSVQTFQVINDTGAVSFIRIHLIPDAGVRNIFPNESARIAGEDPDYLKRSLYNSIASGENPSWTMAFQVLTPDDVDNSKLDVFDVTVDLPQDLYPLRNVGKIVLNRNAKNYFKEIEQIAFCPGNIVPGILGAPGKFFDARTLIYRQTQKHRLGINFRNIPVNKPKNKKVSTYHRDGLPPVGGFIDHAPNYYSNSFDGPEAINDRDNVKLKNITENPEPNNLLQAKEYYENGINEEERVRVIDNLAASLGQSAELLQERAINLFSSISTDLGEKLRIALNRKK